MKMDQNDDLMEFDETFIGAILGAATKSNILFQFLEYFKTILVSPLILQRRYIEVRESALKNKIRAR